MPKSKWRALNSSPYVVSSQIIIEVVNQASKDYRSQMATQLFTTQKPREHLNKLTFIRINLVPSAIHLHELVCWDS